MNGRKANREVLVEIAPQIRGRITSRDLIKAEATILIVVNGSQIGGHTPGILFRLVSNSYYLEAGFTGTQFYIARNCDKLEMTLQPAYKPTSYFRVFATWSPTELSLDCKALMADSMLADPTGKAEEIGRKRKVLKTPITFPPNSLINWARDESIVPVTTYGSVETFNEVVTSSLFQSIQDKVSTLGLSNPFWDITYDGAKIISKKPKREIDIHPTIRGLLFEIVLAKNIQIYPEYPIAGGQLDFLVSGNLNDGSAVNACIEFKHAHSRDLLHGLLNQLPAYMRAKGCNFGLYCVMYFKGEDFDEPKYDYNQLEILLNGEKVSAGLSNIRIIIFDFSHKKPPSKS
jgi:hypothetical protein